MMTRSRIALVVLLICSGLAQAWAPLPPRVKANRTPVVHAVGVYEGANPPGAVQPGQPSPPGVVRVTVANTEQPVILVLTAYDPVIWHIDAPNSNVVKVIASGYHDQTVTGLKGKVPVVSSSYDSGSKDYFYAYRKWRGGKRLRANPNKIKGPKKTTRKYDKFAQRVKEITGQEVATFQGSYTGEAFQIVDPPKQPKKK